MFYGAGDEPSPSESIWNECLPEDSLVISLILGPKVLLFKRGAG
jgi:hypothetical protein